MANYIYGAISLTGGGTGSLDAIDGDILAANDACIVFMNNTTYIYSLDASSGAAENSPEIIAPDSNPGTKRWLLVRTNADQIDLVTTSFTGILSASDDDVQKALDTIDNLSITHDKIWEDNSYVEVVDDGTNVGYIEVIADGIQVQYWDAQAATIRMGKLSGAGKVEVSDTGVSASVGAVEILSLTENTQRLGVSGDSRIVISQSADSVDIYAGDGAGAVGTFEVDGLTLTSGTNVNEFSIDGTLAGNSDNATPTEKAVKTYVDTSLGGISSDKIMEGDSYVEVIDDGTNAGYIEVVADGVQVQYWDAEASSIRMGKASGAGRITITDATVLTSIGSEDLLSLEVDNQRIGTYNDTAIDVDQTGSTIIATANTTEVVSVNENLQTIGVSADTFITVNQTDEETVVTDNSIEAFKIEFEGVSLENGVVINEFSDDGTLADDSDTAIPTEKAVKTYVDTKISEVDEHNEVSGLQGGDATSNEYYHLTEEEFTTTTGIKGIDDTPDNGVTDKSISSNWAYDHENATAVHGATSANTANRIVSRDASGNFTANVITATVTQARYADLAEKYTCRNEDLITGTVVCAATSGEYEVEQCDREKCSNVIGVISAEAGYVMNSDLKNSVTVGLVGKVPVRIIGSVQKGQPIISTGNGCARGVKTELELLYKMGATLEANGDAEEKLVYCAIK